MQSGPAGLPPEVGRFAHTCGPCSGILTWQIRKLTRVRLGRDPSSDPAGRSSAGPANGKVQRW
jgi:hypothetical protein